MNDKDLLTEAKERYKEAEDLWKDNRKLWLEDAAFRAGNHWPEKVKKEREEANRPTLVVDKTEQHVRQVVNDGRQNRPAPKVSPVDDKGDVKTAEGIKGLIRSISNKSKADEAYDTALDHAAGCGFGFIRICTEYEHEKTFNQDLKIRRVRNPMAVLLGPTQEADGSDADYGFFSEDVPKKTYKRRWPKAKEVNWNSDSYQDGWSADHTVRVCEYFYKVWEQGTIFLLDDGTTVTAEEYVADPRPTRPAVIDPMSVEVDWKPGVKDSREIPVAKVKHCVFSGAEVLEKNDWLGKYIPIIPVYGNEQDIEGKVIYSGLIRASKDPQRLYDYSNSGFAEHVALSTKNPYIAAAGQLEGFETDWKNSNTENIAVLMYNPVDVAGHPVPPPARPGASGVPQGLAQYMQISEHDIQGSMGMYAASLGNKGNATSGVQEKAQIREGDTGTFHYQDNLNRAVRYVCRQLVDLAPKVYDSKRTARILGEDGTATLALFDPKAPLPFEKRGSQVIYNLSIGTYDVDVEAGPSYTTRRQEASESMLGMAQRNPAFWQTHGDIIAESQDWPNAERFAKRSKLMLPPEIREAEEEGAEEMTPEARQARLEVKQIKQEAEQAIAERDQALMQAQDDLKKAQDQQRANELKAETDLYNAQTNRMKVEAELGRVDPVAPVEDNSAELAKIELDRERLRLEDEWKKLEAETKVVCATIAANSKPEPSEMGPDGKPVKEEVDSDAPAPVDTNLVVAAALEQFQMAIQGFSESMSRPRTLLRGPDGRVSGIQ